ncbi:MAG TPA: hypothetical protein VGF94_04615 [Kofleriaceae bacterium]|jgi:hypothetical protein
MTKLTLLALVTLTIGGTALADTPKPPPEMADMLKSMTGTWRCTGTGMGMDGKDTKFTGTMTTKSDLDGYWGHDSFSGTMGEGKTAMKYKFESYMTFDPTTKKWRNMMMDNMGGSMAGTSDGMKDMKMEVDAETQDMRGKAQFKDHMDMSDLKKGAHMWGEESRDSGKTWNKVYDMVCKK